MGKKSAKQVTNFLGTSALTRPLFALGAASMLFGSGSAYATDPGALPQNPNVVGGKDSFSQSGNTLNVNQSTNRTVIDWRSFDIGSKAQVNFAQPGKSSIAVNRINGSTNPTDIEGGLHANGQVWILNPNGVFFGKGARVDAAGIVATTANINDKAFMAGSNKLQMTGADHGSVENQGNISVGANGLAAFVAPSVRNSGTINATVGRVALAAGTTYTLDLAGDHLVELGLGSVKAVVDNSGKIVNPGGTIALTAKAAGQVVNSVVNVSGVVSASSVSKSGGTITLGADTVNTTSTAQLSADAGTSGNGGTITSVANVQGNYAGAFSAKGGSTSGDGGKVETSGKSVHVDDGIKINTLASNGFAGNWTLDPVDLVIADGASTENPVDTTAATVTNRTIVDQLATTGVTLAAEKSITVNGAIDASGQTTATTTLALNDSGGVSGLTLNLNALITLGAHEHLTGQATTVNVANGASIQNGIDAAATGATVNLAAATYALSSGITIGTNGITLEGVSGTKISASSAGALNAITISGDNVTVKDLEIDIDPTGTSTGNAINGVDILGTADHAAVTNLTIRGEVTTTGNGYIDYAFGNPVSRGIVAEIGAANFTISDNDIRNVRTGILLAGGTNSSNSTPTNSGGSVTDNLIDNTKGALLINYNDGTGVTITGNKQGSFGNEWGEIWDLQGAHTGAASGGVQTKLLAASNANHGWTVEDQAYAQSNRTAVTVAATATNASGNPSDSNQGSYRSPLATVQAGVNAVVAGGTVNVLGGNYTLTSELDIDKSLSLVGAGVGVTNITSTSTSYGIFVDANSVTLDGFTYSGPTAHTNSTYGIKVQPNPTDPAGASARLTDFVIGNVTINGGYHTGLDLNGVDRVTINNVNVSGIANGDGINLTDSANVTITNSSTTGNAWGGLAISQTNRFYDQQTSNITVAANNSFGELNSVFLQDESVGGSNSVVSGNGLDFDFATLNIAGYDYAVLNSNGRTQGDGATFIWLQNDQQKAVDFAMGSFGMINTGSSYIEGWNKGLTNMFTVGISSSNHAMSIQTAVNAASSGDTIDVLAGTYSEAVNINKSLTLEGANAGVAAAGGTGTPPETRGAETIMSHSNLYAFDVNATDVTIDGFEFTGGSGRLIDWASSSNIDGLTIENNIFNTPSGAADGGVIQLSGTGTAHNVEIANNLFEGAGSSSWLYIGGTHANGFSGLDISGNDFVGSADNAVFQGAATFDGLHIAGNYFGHALIAGLNMGSLDDPTIDANTFVGVQDVAMQIGTVNGGVIENNIIDGTGSGYNSGGVLYASGIEVWGGQYGTATSDGLQILNNSIKNYVDASPVSPSDRFAAIYLRPADSGPGGAGPVTIEGNTIQNDTVGILANTSVTGSTVSGNIFLDNDTHVLDLQNGLDLVDMLGDNSFDSAVVNANAADAIYGHLQTAIDKAGAGDTLDVTGTFVTTGQIEIDKDLTIAGDAAHKALFKVGTDFASNDVAGAWILVDPDVNFSLSNVVLDGSGHQVSQAIRSEGNTTIDSVDFRNIRYSDYYGVAVASFGGYVAGGLGSDTNGLGSSDAHLVVTNSTFQNIGRDGVLVKGDGSTADIAGNTYIGKGAGDYLDYGVEVGAGGQATITGNTITGALGVASDGSTSAGIEVTTFYGTPTSAVIENNVITGNTVAVDVGYDDPTTSADDDNDTSTVVAFNNNFSGNGVELESTNASADFTGNYWGTTDAAAILAKMTGLRADDVNFSTYLTSGTDTSTAAGFQGDFSNLTVTTLGGGTDRIAEAVSEATTGGTIDVNSGTYAEDVSVGKQLSFNFDDVTVDSLTLSSGAAGSSLKGELTATGAIASAGSVNLSGGFTAASIALNGAVTLSGDTSLKAANGAIKVASVNGTTAGGQSLAINAGTGTVSLGDLGATTRLGAVSDASKTTLTGSTYNANSFLFGGDVTLASASTTLNTTQSSGAAGDITFKGDIFGTKDGAQSLTLIAGSGKGAASANGDITLQNAGTSAVELGDMTVSGNNFTALTVWLAGNYASTLTGNQVFAADTLHTGGNVNSNVGGDASGHIVSQGDVDIAAKGDVSGNISGDNVNLSGDDVNSTVTANGNANVNGNTVEGSYTGDNVSIVAADNVDAAVNATNFTLVAPGGSVDGTWTNASVAGSGIVYLNGDPQIGVNPSQLVVEGFVLPAGTTIGPNGQLILPQGVLLGLLSPGGGKPKMILVHSVQELGQLLASGYSVIVIDLSTRGSNKPVQLASN